MKKVTVEATGKYDIIIGKDIIGNVGEYVAECIKPCKCLIVSDDNVAPLYLGTVQKSLEKNGFIADSYVIPHGEQSKNLENFGKILNYLAGNRFSRSDAVVALGGGVVGDLAGFCAAAYMRGIDFIQIPTSLLAAVDSSVGGKTAVDLDCGKNLAGAFHQPKLVLCDYGVLESLPESFFSDGMAEVIKYGFIGDKKLIEILEGDITDKMEEVITRCVEKKRDIVCEDEFERGTRKLLNFGHTIGHAAELSTNYTLPHGHAVAIGMHIMTNAFVKQKKCEPDCILRLDALLEKYNLPKSCDIDVHTLFEAAKSDKKRSGKSIDIVMPTETGRCVIMKTDVEELEKIIAVGIEE